MRAVRRPDLLRLFVPRTAGLPTTSEFEVWMERNSLSLSSVAESLGMTRRMIAHYRTGSNPIPIVVGLACKGWETQRAAHS